MVPKRIVAIVFPVFLVAAPACAQRVGNDQLEALRESHPDRREHCQLWRDKLPAASGRQEYRDVLHKLAFCDATGPDAFAAEWRNPSGRDVEALLSWSRLLRDRRLL